MNEDQPHFLALILKRTPDVIPAGVIEQLDLSAGYLRSVQQRQAEAMMLGTGGKVYADAQGDAAKAGLQIMIRAVDEVVRASVMAAWRDGSPSATAVAQAAESLRLLSEESAKAADLVARKDSEPELREALAHLKAYCDAQEEVQSLRST